MAILRWGRRWDPFEDLEKMRRQMEHVLRTAAQAGGRAGNMLFGERSFPLINLYETNESYIATAEVPGVKADEIEIAVTGDTLTVKGKRQAEVDREQVNCHRQERDFGSFARTVNLPGAIATDQVDATYVDGVLQVMLPKAEENKPRVIQVQQTKEVEQHG